MRIKGMDMPQSPDRRRLLAGGGALFASMALASLFPAWARSATAGAVSSDVLTGEDIALSIAGNHFSSGGRSTHHAVMVNGMLPAPLIRLREGQNVRIAVTNRLSEQTSIHWHGLLVPFQMDGVPGVSFPGIDPGETFTYEFPVRHAGTYWYHSHSGMQEAVGLFGPIVIDPMGADPIGYDREHVIVLSDWSPMHPHEQLRRLKLASGYFNHRKQTIAGLLVRTR
jgi:L-ascorbate oxidase